MPPASAASGDEGLLYLPPATSIAHCPSSCGDVSISYPFGIGAGCFRQGFELTCNHTTQPPKLFLGNSTTQLISGMDDGLYILQRHFGIRYEQLQFVLDGSREGYDYQQ
nr:unnamed protein product [Digitaria exilis]